MKTRMLFLTVIATLVLALGCRNQQQPPAAKKMRVQEGFSQNVIARLNTRNQRIEAGIGATRFSTVQAVIRKFKIWPTNTITVAFRGGSPALRKQITGAVVPWMNAAGIQLDFGETPSGSFREWSTSDTAYAANIRIGFDQRGYWSLVGNDSVKPSIVDTNQASMNFEGFTGELPADWQAVVLHEFGHALGFEHEHQSPIAPCDQEFRWDDDPGYVRTTDIYGQFVPDSQGKRPGIYTVLGGPPNSWPKDQIDFNLKKLAYTPDLLPGPFDKTSIMKYYFEDWMFTQGTASRCYSQENLKLSSEDIQFVKTVYSRAQANNTLSQPLKDMQGVVTMTGLPEDIKAELRKNIAEYKLAVKKH